jgi:hypothetical protein
MTYTAQQAAADSAKLRELAAEHERAGNQMMAGLFRVEAANCIHHVGHVKQHMPTLGPYMADNPERCEHCGKPGADWVHGEECVP